MLKKQQTYEELQESIMRYHKCNIKLNFQNQKLHNKIASLENQIQELQASIDKSKLLLADVSNCNYKEKYEKCINVIKRFDAGIISMYDL